MLDNIFDRVRRGAERVQRRGEEVTQIARLRLELFQLGREQDGLYARLGRAYHAGTDLEVLQGIREEIRRVDEEIGAREQLIHELGQEPPTEAAPEPLPVPERRPGAAPAPSTERTVPAAVPPLQETPMTRRDSETDATTDPTLRHSDELLVPGDATGEQGDDLGRESREKSYTHRNQLDEGRRASEDPDPLD